MSNNNCTRKYKESKHLMFSGRKILSNLLKAKKVAKSNRERTTLLFLLRCVEIGVSVRARDLLTIGLVLYM